MKQIIVMKQNNVAIILILFKKIKLQAREGTYARK